MAADASISLTIEAMDKFTEPARRMAQFSDKLTQRLFAGQQQLQIKCQMVKCSIGLLDRFDRFEWGCQSDHKTAKIVNNIINQSGYRDHSLTGCPGGMVSG